MRSALYRISPYTPYTPYIPYTSYTPYPRSLGNRPRPVFDFQLRTFNPQLNPPTHAATSPGAA